MKIARAFAVAMAAVVLISGGHYAFGADGVISGTPDAELADILKTKVTVSYRSEYLVGIALDLWGRSGLRGVCPMPIRTEHVYTFDLKEKTVREVLERVAADGGLQIECRGRTVVFWKPAADGVIADLGKQLRSHDVRERVMALSDLGRLGDKRVYPLIFSALNDSNEAVAFEAVHQLACQSDYLPHGRILRMVSGTDAYVSTLMKDISPEKVEKVGGFNNILVGSAGFSNILSRWRIVTSLDGPNARQAMRQFLTHPNYAPLAALMIANDESIEAYIQNLLKSDGLSRRSALCLMAKRGLRRDLDQLLAFLNGPDKDSAVSAMCALGNIGWGIDELGPFHDPRIFPVLNKFAGDSDVRVRVSAVEALCKTQDPRALETVYKLLSDPVNEVRYAAAMNAHNLPNIDSQTIERIAKMAENETDINVRHPAAIGLRRIADGYAVQCMIELLNSPKPEVRADFCDLISQRYYYYTNRVDDPAIVPALLKLTQDDAHVSLWNDQVRHHALEALGSFPCPLVTGTLSAAVLLPEKQLNAIEWEFFATRAPQVPGCSEFITQNTFDSHGGKQRLMDARAWGAAAKAWVCADPEAGAKIAKLPGEHPLLIELLAEATGDPRVVQRLFPMTASADVAIRRMTVDALNHCRQRNAFYYGFHDFPLTLTIPPLTELAKDSDPHVSETAATALLQMSKLFKSINVAEVLASIPDPAVKARVAKANGSPLPNTAQPISAAKSESGAAAIASPGDVTPETKKMRDALLNAAKDEARKKIKSGVEKALAKHPKFSPDMQAMMRSSSVQETWLKVIVNGAFLVCAKPVSDAQFVNACEAIRRMREGGTGLEGDAFIDDYVSKAIEASAKPGDAGKPASKK